MTRIAISVEGFTENEVVRTMISPHLQQFGAEVTPVIVQTKRLSTGKKFKGGSVSLDRVTAEISRLLPNFDFVTTMYDYYGFSGIPQNMSPDALEKTMYNKINSARFLPYLQVHEFEAVLFSNPEVTAECLGINNGSALLSAIVEECGAPEMINSRPELIPSARLESLCAGYDKTFHGPYCLMEIGINDARMACPRLNDWIGKLEKIAGV